MCLIYLIYILSEIFDKNMEILRFCFCIKINNIINIIFICYNLIISIFLRMRVNSGGAGNCGGDGSLGNSTRNEKQISSENVSNLSFLGFWNF